MSSNRAILFFACLIMGLLNGYAIEVETSEAGSLAMLVSDNQATELVVKGNVDARDLKFIAEEMTALTVLDLSNAKILAIKTDNPCFGDAFEYAENTLPDYCFFAKHYEKVLLPVDLKKIGEGAFAGCKNLLSVDIPVGLKEIGRYAFSACDALSGVVLGSNLEMIADGAFMRCMGMKKADMSTVSAECSLGSMIFADCVSLESVKLGENVRYLPIRAFAGCSLLAKIEFAEISALDSIGEEAFASTALSSFDFDRCVNLKKIEDWAFADTKINDINLSEGVSKVGEGAFFANESVTRVSMPSTLAEIGSVAFAEGKSLTEMKVAATEVPTLGEKVWHGVTQRDVKVTVPKDKVSDYKSTDQWCEFNIVGDISAIENVNDNNAIKAYISNGYLIVKASEDIARIEVYELNGIGIASLSPMSMNAYLDLTNTDTDVYVATITLRSGKTMIIKLIRQ